MINLDSVGLRRSSRRQLPAEKSLEFHDNQLHQRTKEAPDKESSLLYGISMVMSRGLASLCKGLAKIPG